jgi:hypothetical protein
LGGPRDFSVDLDQESLTSSEINSHSPADGRSIARIIHRAHGTRRKVHFDYIFVFLGKPSQRIHQPGSDFGRRAPIIVKTTDNVSLQIQDFAPLLRLLFFLNHRVDVLIVMSDMLFHNGSDAIVVTSIIDMCQGSQRIIARRLTSQGENMTRRCLVTHNNVAL